MHTALVSKSLRLLAGFTLALSLRAASVDACGLLSPEAIRQATGEEVTNTKLTSQTAGKVRQSQCFYALPTFANSISVTLTGSAREIWQRWFHRKDDDGGEEEAAAKAVPVTGLGDEAWWVRSFVGNLYVRKGNQLLRISLGGKLSDGERQSRARLLAAVALRNLK